MPPSLTRRQCLGAAAAALAPRAFAQATPGARGDGRLIVVFLRGAVDGLSLLVPYTDRDYARLRPSIALPAPDGTDQAALRLDGTFALHPALSNLLPLWQQGVLAAVPAAGSPDPTRSHFDAQYQWETARPGKTSDAPGWLNTLAALGGAPNAVHAVGVGEANPRILAGRESVKLVARGQAASRAGVLDNPRTRAALLAVYGGDDAVSQAFRQGAGSRLQTAEELQREMQAADNGAAPPALLAQDARNLGTLMRQERALRIGFLSAGGWDTHANQGAATGSLANNLRNLAAALVQLRSDFNQPGDVIVVASEFGRTAAENGTRGTDHGHGNAMWLIGQRIAGGRWHGDWSGLAPGNLHEARDVPVHHDFRAVLAQVLRPGFGLTDSQLATVLPGVNWDRRLDGLLRRG
ncbi:DUF1501 domain-containing protein [Ottowia testudinis]|uniref:DUF1501 domain-containing protein n=1 Tax=Ottowia testudinis TaxID=2816950 RepID=A0A975CGH5_9BURK|nr:DUF1501 domain-containing protein [Ottowia testudinis]QTD44666.1 DUF1501 domain-containing protein [Ottowia testudinis]